MYIVLDRKNFQREIILMQLYLKLQTATSNTVHAYEHDLQGYGITVRMN